FYHYLANVSVPLLGTDVVLTPEINGVRSGIQFIFFLLCGYFGFIRRPPQRRPPPLTRSSVVLPRPQSLRGAVARIAGDSDWPLLRCKVAEPVVGCRMAPGSRNGNGGQLHAFGHRAPNTKRLRPPSRR